MDLGGTMYAWASLYFVHPGGGTTPVDLRVCNTFSGFPAAWQLENSHFSGDGKTYFCSVRLPENIREEGKLLHPKGLYHISVDVGSGRYQHRVETLPK